MKHIIIALLILFCSIAACAKPHCQGFNNYDNKVTIVFTDDNAGEQYTVADAKLIPSSWRGEEFQATSVTTTVKNGVATVTLVFPHITRFSNPKVTLRINGKKKTFKVCQ